MSKSFSIVICNHNYGQFLQESINSCLALDYSKDLFEIIVVDDGSTDNSREIIKKFENEKNFKFISQENAGQAAAIKKGVLEAKNEIICLLDSDDYFEKDKLKKLNEHIESNGLSNQFFLCHNSNVRIENEDRLWESTWFDNIQLSSSHESLHIQQITHPSPFNNPCGQVYSADLLKQIIESIPTADWYQGTDSIIAQSALMITGRVHYLHELLSTYRVHGKNSFWQFENNKLKAKIDWRNRRHPKLLWFLEKLIQCLDLTTEEKAHRLTYLKRQENTLRIASQNKFDTQPKISFLITNYNYAQFLPAAIESIYNQNYPNIEIVVIDDKSTDDSLKVIDKLKEESDKVRGSDRFKVIVNKNNLGQLGAIAAGYKSVTGSYLVLLDADDLLDDIYIEKQLYTHRFSTLCMVTSCDIRFIDGENALVHNSCYSSVGSWKKPLEYFAPFSFSLKDWVFAPRTANMFRRTKMLDLLFESLDQKTIKAFRTKGEWLLLYYANMLGGNTRLNECLVNFRLHSSNQDTHLHFPTPLVKAIDSGDPDYNISVELFMKMFIENYSSFKSHYSPAGLFTYISWLYKQSPEVIQKVIEQNGRKVDEEIISLFKKVKAKAK